MLRVQFFFSFYQYKKKNLLFQPEPGVSSILPCLLWVNIFFSCHDMPQYLPWNSSILSKYETEKRQETGKQVIVSCEESTQNISGTKVLRSESLEQ